MIDGDFYIFFAHLLIMGVVKKPSIQSYWAKDDRISTPFFGKYMSRNKFQAILSNIQVAKAKENPRDKLHKIRPFIQMCEDNFASFYTPERELSVDEGCIPFRGRVSFRVYNPNKPHKYHMKIYTLCEAQSGYVLSVIPYTGLEQPTKVTSTKKSTKPKSVPISTTVKNLLAKAGALGHYHHLYMDNFYSSPDLYYQLLEQNTYAVGTVRANRKGLPQGCGRMGHKNVKPLLRENDVAWRRSRCGSLLALRLVSKRLVYFISTVHSANWVSKKTNYLGAKIWKPEVTEDYNHFMMGVDVSDQKMQYYQITRRSLKWSRKMLIHYFNMAVTNAHILFRKQTGSKNHLSFRLQLASQLIAKGLAKKAKPSEWEGVCVPLVDQSDHYPELLPSTQKRVKPYRKCKCCIQQGRCSKNHTCYRCKSCLVPLHPQCFQQYHGCAEPSLISSLFDDSEADEVE